MQGTATRDCKDICMKIVFARQLQEHGTSFSTDMRFPKSSASKLLGPCSACNFDQEIRHRHACLAAREQRKNLSSRNCSQGLVNLLVQLSTYAPVISLSSIDISNPCPIERQKQSHDEQTVVCCDLGLQKTGLRVKGRERRDFQMRICSSAHRHAISSPSGDTSSEYLFTHLNEHKRRYTRSHQIRY